MDPKIQTDEFERYRLEVEPRDGHVAQRINQSNNGLDIWQKWKRNRYLGYGQFGEVWQEACEDEYGDLQYRAVKVCSEVKMRAARIDYRRELTALAAFSRSKYTSHFVNMHGWWIDNGNLCVAMEYLRFGDLSRYATALLAELEIREIAENVLHGLGIMHNEGFTHRDIKPQNILVCHKRPEFHRWWVKIADFGISKRTGPDCNTDLRTFIGTPLYCAPEVLGHLDEVQEGSTYSSKVDMWSFGCVLFNLSTRGHTAFTNIQLMRYCEGTVPFNPKGLAIHLSSPGIAFVMALLHVKPQQRPAVAEALQHPWLMKLDDFAVQSHSNALPNVDLAYRQNYNTFLDSPISTQNLSHALIANSTHHVQKAAQSLNKDSLEATTNSQPAHDPTGDEQPVHHFVCLPSHARKSDTSQGISSERDDRSSTPSSLNSVENNDTLGSIQDPPGARSPILEDAEIDLQATLHRGGSSQSSRSQAEAADSTHLEAVNRATVHTDTHQKLEKAIDESNQAVDSVIVSLDKAFPLIDAAKLGHLEVVTWLINHGADVHKPDEHGETALHYAAKLGHLETVKFLIDHGADINIFPAVCDETPLHHAVRGRHLRIVKWLVNNGVDISVADKHGHTALHLAALQGDLEMICWLVGHGADMNETSVIHETALHLAAWRNHLEVVEWLAEHDADIDKTSETGHTALHFAAANGHLEVVESLVDHGADLYARDNGGDTPRILARVCGKRQVFEFLKARMQGITNDSRPLSPVPMPGFSRSQRVSRPQEGSRPQDSPPSPKTLIRLDDSRPPKASPTLRSPKASRLRSFFLPKSK